MKIGVRLVSPQGVWEEGDKTFRGNVEPFQVEETQKVKDALKVKMLERVRDMDEQPAPPAPTQEKPVKPADEKPAK